MWNVLAIQPSRPGSKPRNIGLSITLARSSKLTKPFPSVTRNAAAVRTAMPNAQACRIRALAIAGGGKLDVGRRARLTRIAACGYVAEALARRDHPNGN